MFENILPLKQQQKKSEEVKESELTDLKLLFV